MFGNAPYLMVWGRKPGRTCRQSGVDGRGLALPPHSISSLMAGPSVSRPVENKKLSAPFGALSLSISYVRSLLSHGALRTALVEGLVDQANGARDVANARFPGVLAGQGTVGEGEEALDREVID